MVLVLVSITETVSSSMLVTYIRSFFESYAIPTGRFPTRIGLPVTVLVLVSITETELFPVLVTYICSSAESYSINVGSLPTGIGLPVTVLVLVSITETELLPILITYIRSFAESYAKNSGEPAGIGLPITVLVLVSITETELFAVVYIRSFFESYAIPTGLVFKFIVSTDVSHGGSCCGFKFEDFCSISASTTKVCKTASIVPITNRDANNKYNTLVFSIINLFNTCY